MICNTNTYLDPFFRPLFEVIREGEKNKSFGSFSMKTDILETENSYLLFVDLPGITKENIKLSFEDNYLRLTVNTGEADKENKYLHRERFCGEATRSYYMEGVDEKAIKAHFENGVLHIEVPKAKEETKTTTIEIN